MNLNYAKMVETTIQTPPLRETATQTSMDQQNKKPGALKYYTDLEGTNGHKKRTNMRFLLGRFVANTSDLRLSHGFAANQPKIDWAQGWIDTTQLPLILRSADAIKTTIQSKHAQPT